MGSEMCIRDRDQFVLSLVEIGSVVPEMKCFKFVIVLLQIRNYMYIPLENGGALYLNKLESSPKDCAKFG